MAHHLNRLYWIPIAAVVVLLVWLVWLDGKRGPTGFLFGMGDARGEAGYCLAVAERARGLTRGQGEPKLEAFLTENILFWRARADPAMAAAGQAALGADLSRPGRNEGAHLHLALQDCGLRAVSLYGYRFSSMQ